MKLGIIECGRHRPELQRRFGPYSAMFMRWLSPAAPDLGFEVIDLVNGEPIGATDRCDAWLIGGSPSGVYDPEPWIPELSQFIKAAYAEGAPMIGVCFGHQMLAHALGGRVEKSEKGWGVGVHEYALHAQPNGLELGAKTLRLRAMHQDQIVALPPEATRVAGSDFCPNAALVYGALAAPKAVSLQPHPEFEADFAAALIEMRMKDAIPEAVARRALESLERRGEAFQPMNADIADWVAAFLKKTVN